MNPYLKQILRIGLITYIIIAVCILYLSTKIPSSDPVNTSSVVSSAREFGVRESTSGVSITEGKNPNPDVPAPLPEPPSEISPPEILNPTPLPPATPTPLERAASHTTRSDCWIVVGNNVYNVTPFFGKHPGGDSALAKYCGRDATIGFNTKELLPPEMHSITAEQLLASFLVP